MPKLHAELLDRYVAALVDARFIALAAAAAVAAIVVTARFRHDAKPMRIARGAVLGTAMAAAMVWAWHLRWLCDDAFISFRYAENLARGHGLVFNVGDRVEGYTNFLWTVALTGLRLLGSDIPQASIILSLTCFAMLIVLTARVASMIQPRPARALWPLAAVLSASQYTLASFGTSGLETMLGAMLVMLAIERAMSGAYFASGLAGVCAAMSHPDHGIFYVALALVLLLNADRNADRRRALIEYSLPFLLLYVPYFIWRVRYYGDLFPNTYYAKSADQAYFAQGSVYLLVFLVGSGFVLALPTVIYGGWLARSTLLARFCLIAVPLFSLYVAKIGGDFMYGRLMCALIAPLLVLGEVAVNRSLTDGRWARAAALALLLAVAALPTPVLKPGENRWHQSDERTIYPLATFEPLRVRSAYFDWGNKLAAHFTAYSQSPRLGIFCVGMMGYLSGLPMIDGYGLTDRFIAHSPVVTRGRPGHEKRGQPAYFLRREVDITEDFHYPIRFQSMTRFFLDGVPFHFLRYDPKIIAQLRKKPTARFYDYERYLRHDLSKRAVTAQNAHATACDAWFAEELYFARSPRSHYRAKVRDKLLAAGAPLIDGMLMPSQVVFREAETHVRDPATRLGFEPSDRGRVEHSGTAFETFPSSGEVLGQHMIGGREGSLVNTYHPKLLDTALGRLRSKPLALVGDVMELRVGGGYHPQRLRVSLVVDGKRLYSTGGCDTELMGRRLWDISAFKGRSAVLEVVDEWPGAWGHIVVDEVVQWVPKR